MTVFGVALAWPRTGFAASLVLLAVVGFFGGFFYVPIAAIMQHRPAKGEKGGVLGAANLLSPSSACSPRPGVYWILTVPLGLSTRQVFLACAIATLAGTVYVVRLLPDALLRLLLWMLTHTVYRIRVRGGENVPERGGALFVANHMSLRRRAPPDRVHRSRSSAS